MTNIAGVCGALSATLITWLKSDQPDLSMMINGLLAGLVAITACCDVVDYFGTVLIGVVAGLLVVLAVNFIDSMKIDDPVGAIAVHLVNGIWGTIAVGLFANPTTLLQRARETPFKGVLYGGGVDLLISQFIGIAAVGVFIAIFSTVAWYLIKLVFGLRVPLKAELDGLDISEHGMEGYHGFGHETDTFGSAINSNNT